MYVFIGGGLVMLATAYMGFSAASFYKRRLVSIEAFLSLIIHIEAQIDGYLTPVNEILAAYNDKRFSDTDFCGIASSEGGAVAVRRLAGRLCLYPSELSELCTFFEGLGKGTADEEIRHCGYFEKRFSKLSQDAASELRGKVKLFRGLGILGGIMTVIILL